MTEFLFWIYFANSILLIKHEVNSVYRKEWESFNLPGGINAFLFIHIPLLIMVLYGLTLIAKKSFSGIIFSLLLCFSGILAFVIHTYFLKKDCEEFNNPFSKFILVAIYILSVIQMAVTTYIIIISTSDRI